VKAVDPHSPLDLTEAVMPAPQAFLSHATLAHPALQLVAVGWDDPRKTREVDPTTGAEMQSRAKPDSQPAHGGPAQSGDRQPPSRARLPSQSSLDLTQLGCLSCCPVAVELGSRAAFDLEPQRFPHLGAPGVAHGRIITSPPRSCRLRLSPFEDKRKSWE
jgi:hypothetical protein